MIITINTLPNVPKIENRLVPLTIIGKSTWLIWVHVNKRFVTCSFPGHVHLPVPETEGITLHTRDTTWEVLLVISFSIFCFVVAIYYPVHDVETMHGLC